jgi:hypothetical protein
MDFSERKITRGANQTAAAAVRNVTSRISNAALRGRIANTAIMASGHAMNADRTYTIVVPNKLAQDSECEGGTGHLKKAKHAAASNPTNGGAQ